MRNSNAATGREGLLFLGVTYLLGVVFGLKRSSAFALVKRAVFLTPIRRHQTIDSPLSSR